MDATVAQQAGSSAGATYISGNPVVQEGKAYKKPRVKSKPAVFEFLKEYFDTVSPNPNKEQRTHLLAQIHKINGHEDYTDNALSTWFAGRRKKKRDAAQGTGQSGASPYRSLKPESIKTLIILHNETPHPSQELIATWAKLLKCTSQDLSTWISLQRAQGSEHTQAAQSAYDASTYQPPTPTDSATSPEPSWNPPSFANGLIAAGSIFTPEPSQSPVIPHTSVPLSRGPRWTSRLSPFVDQQSAPPKPVPRPPTKRVLASVIDAFSQREVPNTTLPTTAEEFDRLFAPHAEKMESFLKKVENGSLRKFGWHPSMAKDQLDQEPNPFQ